MNLSNDIKLKMKLFGVSIILFYIKSKYLVQLGAFHLTQIPEILLENQIEHVNFWNAVSLILKNLTLPLKSLPSAFGEINSDSRH
jgi:hypothetical protein